MTTDDATECRITDHARALWYLAPGSVEIRAAALPARGADDILVRTQFSAVSRGTERLVFGGLFDPSHGALMRAPLQEGDFPFPVKYGYCAVGRVEDGPFDMLGRQVFVLHPHQDRFFAPRALASLVPEDIPARRATLAANMETALNALWDSGAGAGDRIVVVGAGLVGLLIAYLAARLPGTEVIAIDPQHERKAVLDAFGVAYAPDGQGVEGADVVFHTSATAEGLQTAIACCGQDASLVEVSWHGDRPVTVKLGGLFHARRIKIISSQVGALPPTRAPRWPHARRRATALDLLHDARLDKLITDEVAFADLPGALGRILDRTAPGIATVVRYG